MQIKQLMLAQHLQRSIAPLHILIGKEHFLIEECARTIKSCVKKKHECDEKILYIHASADWQLLVEEANSYCLFADTQLITVFYDKKSIDEAGKRIIMHYLKNPNPNCFIIIRAAEVPAKQIQSLINQDGVVLVVNYPLAEQAMKQWIIGQLNKNNLKFEAEIPQLMYQSTQGNMLACAQLVEKIALANPDNSSITIQKIMEQISDQSQHTLYELVDSCLLGQANKAIHILRQAANNKTEATLVLWMLAQEVRLLVQLAGLIKQNNDFKSASTQLKIWPQRGGLYQAASKRLQDSNLEQLLHLCTLIDEHIKTNSNTQRVWNALEQLALCLCIGTSKERLCAV